MVPNVLSAVRRTLQRSAQAPNSHRIAVIGCGAISEQQHLPSLRDRNIRPSLLVDRNTDRVLRLARDFDVESVTTDYREHLDSFDAAIVALPHHLHAPVCSELLRHGIHVLVEKPMALTVADCDTMRAAADEGQAVLAVGLIRRFMSSATWVKGLLDSGTLGPITSFDFQEGYVFDWAVTPDFFFRRETAGGGVLTDTGVHVLDLLLWLLGDVASFEYFDDSYGGVEADCVLRATLESGATGVVELSRTRELRNTARIIGQHGEVEFELPGGLVEVRPDTLLDISVEGARVRKLADQTYDDWFRLQLDDWLNALETRGRPRVPAEEGRRSVALIDACYSERRELQYPWIRPEVVRSGIGE